LRALVVQPEASVGPGLLGEVLTQKGWELDIRCMDAAGTVLPKHLTGYDAYVILGGFMSTYEEDSYPYFLQVQQLIREAVAARIPTVGICLGGQLIARAFGAHVGPNPVKEVGWYRVHLTKAGQAAPIFTGLPRRFPVFQWHGDTFALPQGAVMLAGGETCFNQVFVYQNCVWALQFHPEVTPAIIAEWARMSPQDIAESGRYGDAETLLQDTRARWESTRPWREQFLNNIEAVLRNEASPR